MLKKIILTILLLSACSQGVPVYTYENTHIIDNILLDDDVCITIDNNKTTYEKGVEKLESNPFLGDEGYSADAVKKTKRDYEHTFKNTSCKNPITIHRDIKVSGIIYPGTCSENVYAGSYNAGSTTYSSGYTYGNRIGNSVYGSYSGVSNTITNSVPVYNTRHYSCIKENYLTDIDFYYDSKYLGKIRNKYWESTNADSTIDMFTKEFLDILNKEKEHD